MYVLGQEVLQRAGRRNAPLRNWQTEWVKIVEGVNCHSLQEFRKYYPSADGVKLKSGFVVTVFNAKGNDYRLLTSIDYDAGIVEVLDVLSHPEYDKESWKNRY